MYNSPLPNLIVARGIKDRCPHLLDVLVTLEKTITYLEQNRVLVLIRTILKGKDAGVFILADDI